MPKIINKRKSRYATIDRDLMRDKRLKSNHKLLYALLCSLSESCDNTVPSYKWLAEQIGYETEGKTEQALQMFMIRNLEPLIKLGMLRIVERKGFSNDYEIYEYTPPTFIFNPQQKCEDSPNKNVETTPNKNVTPYNSYIENRIENTDVSSDNPPKNQNPYSQTLESIKANPLFEIQQKTFFANLTPTEQDLHIQTYLADYPKATFSSIMGFLTEKAEKKKRANTFFQGKNATTTEHPKLDIGRNSTLEEIRKYSKKVVNIWKDDFSSDAEFLDYLENVKQLGVELRFMDFEPTEDKYHPPNQAFLEQKHDLALSKMFQV
jgi:hypothetical protein